jgi:hypothetical protein
MDLGKWYIVLDVWYGFEFLFCMCVGVLLYSYVIICT